MKKIIDVINTANRKVGKKKIPVIRLFIENFPFCIFVAPIIKVRIMFKGKTVIRYYIIIII